jgi:hypothetical protein
LQEIVPANAYKTVKELFVPQSRIEAVKEEAGKLPSLDITEVYERLCLELCL